MPRALPAKPNLEHLKSQAKDLLDAHKRGEREALARIRAAVPAYAHKSNEEIASSPFALHDAQSAIAREYGFVSWAELRTKVSAAGEAEPPIALEGATLSSATGLRPEIAIALNELVAQGAIKPDAPTPAEVPMLPLRNSLIFPGSLVPIDITRPASLQAIEAAMKTEPGYFAVFPQRAIATDRPTRDEIHETGTLCIARLLERPGDPPPQSKVDEATSRPLLAWIVLEGVRWIALQALEQIDPYYVARIIDAVPARVDDDPHIAALDRQLRDLSHRFIDFMPSDRERIHAVVDQTTKPTDLADLVIANFPVPVADKVSYAEETEPSRKLDRAIALLVAELAKVQPAPQP
jgi:hypothetical protein